MLDRLDEVPWQSLQHAYGPAGDVPALLRALIQPEKQEEALCDLLGNIWHQGTVYEASSYAVPFLVELAVEPTVTRRDEILGLIGSLATGKSYLAVHARPDEKSGDFWRKKPDFEQQLRKELQHVDRTRHAVFEQRNIIAGLFDDPNPMVRAGVAYVLSRFPEHFPELGPPIRRAVKAERDPLAAAGMLWCLGFAGDNSSEAQTLLHLVPKNFADPRPAFAAAIALYRIGVRPDEAALLIARQLTAATWFAEACLIGVPWDFSGEISLESIFTDLEPEPIGATRTLMLLLKQANLDNYVYCAIVHDLLHLNFAGGHWREIKELTNTQKEILRRIVETDAAWNNARKLWFLVPDGAKKILKLTHSDLERVRNEMRRVVEGRLPRRWF